MKEKLPSSLNKNEALDNKRKDILRRLLSSAWLHRIVITSILTFLSPSDIHKDGGNSKDDTFKSKNYIEALFDVKDNALMRNGVLFDSSRNAFYESNSLSEEEYNDNIAADPPKFSLPPK